MCSSSCCSSRYKPVLTVCVGVQWLGGPLYACRADHDASTTRPSLTLVILGSCSRSAKPGLSHWWIRSRANQAVIRGQPLLPKNEPVARQSQSGSSTSRHWCIIDIDSLPWDDDFQDHQAALAGLWSVVQPFSFGYHSQVVGSFIVDSPSA
jgi:hypothetical protein